MKLLQLNDTHKGFSNNTDKIHRKFFAFLAQQQFDAIVHCGDMIANQQKNVESTFRQMRELAGDKPVMAVRGNHDYWQNQKKRVADRGWMTFSEILASHLELAEKYNVILLDEGKVFETDSVFIGGFTTWYHSIKPNTNDFNWMDYYTEDMKTVSEVLIQKQMRQLTELETALIDRVGKARVVVSHMPIFGTEFDQKYTASYNCQIPLKWNCEYYLCGHSHKFYDGTIAFGDTKVYQTGSDYDKPRYQIVEVKL